MNANLFELLTLYRWPLISAFILGPTLALIGAQILARGWSLPALIASQASSTGVVIGLAFTILFGLEGAHTYGIVLISAIAVSLAAASIAFGRRDHPARSATMLALFALLMAASALIAASVPRLEANMSSLYVGDIATSSDIESRLGLGIGFGLLAWVWWKWSPLTSTAFEKVVLQRSQRPEHEELAFSLVSIATIAIVVQSFGLMFAIGSLFIGSTAVGRQNSNLHRHRRDLAITAALGTGLGFLASLFLASPTLNLPTTPCILIGQLAVGLVVRAARSR